FAGRGGLPPTGEGFVVPDGGVDLLWVPGQAPVIAGPDVAPRRSGLGPGQRVLGVRLRPGVAGQLLGAPVDRIVGAQVPLDSAWACADVAPLQDELETGPAGGHPGHAVAVLSRAVARRVPADWSPDPMVDAVVAAIRAGTPTDVGGLGPRQFRRRFTSAMGYGPATFRRIARLDRVTELLAASPDAPLADLAATAGYYDQAHLNRDCRDLLGVTPGELRPVR
ncbi:MAG: helix-turn-helix domain-containing protein, partial [Actinomycetota bacterium]